MTDRDSREAALVRIRKTVNEYFTQSPHELLTSDLDLLEILIEEEVLRNQHTEAQDRTLFLQGWKGKAFYFGCDNISSGHFLFDVWFKSTSYPGKYYGCGPWEEIDGKLAPYIGTEKRRRSTYDNGQQTEGLAVIHHKDGWTALAFWDRSVDTRGGCNANFFFEGEHTYEEMVELSKKIWPSIWARFKYDVRPLEMG